MKVEDTETVSPASEGQHETVSLKVASRPGQAIRPIASDVKIGDIVAKKGDIIGPAEIGLFATVGTTQV